MRRWDAHRDDEAAPEMVQAALDAVEAREGPDFPGWSRTNSSLTRKRVWEIFRNSAEDVRKREGGVTAKIIARNVRQPAQEPQQVPVQK